VDEDVCDGSSGDAGRHVERGGAAEVTLAATALNSSGAASGSGAPDSVLTARGLTVAFQSEAGPVEAVRGVDLEVGRGEVVALVGESGSGKTVSALALFGLLPRSAQVAAESASIDGQDLPGLDRDVIRGVRRGRAGMIFQDPLSSLNPVQRIGPQIAEAVALQTGVGRAQAQARTLELLDHVGIPDAKRRYREYPHQFSGGMRQRAMIAMALAGSPSLLVADEPTTALDVTVQAQILELIQSLRAEHGMGVLLITHDLGVVAGIADRVLVMYAGRIVEGGPTHTIMASPRHRYTLGLLQSIPRLDVPGGSELVSIKGAPPQPGDAVSGCAFAPRCAAASERCAELPPLAEHEPGRAYACWHPAQGRDAAPAAAGAQRAAAATELAEPVLTVGGVRVVFGKGRRLLPGGTPPLTAVDGVDLEIGRGQTLGLVGESGSGKTTLGRAIVQLTRPEAGAVAIDGREIGGLSEKALRPLRRDFQIVFQDPQSSLNPRHRIGRILGEPLRLNGLVAGKAERDQKVAELLELVGLSARMATRLPHELSGGQRQRVGIARALAVEPKLIVLDESVSALDVSVQAQILTLLERLQDELGVAYLFIAHDLAVVRHISDAVAVMYLGQIVENGPSEEVYVNPRHPYTAALLSAVPVPDPERERGRERIVLRGDPPSPADPPAGCSFHTRCWLREQLGNPERCVAERPALEPVGDGGRRAACHFADELPTHLAPDALLTVAEVGP
jgi:peptide/nickel transport system ATP-binding protein